MSEIPNGSILKDNQIYILFDYSREEIPNGSIIYGLPKYLAPIVVSCEQAVHTVAKNSVACNFIKYFLLI